VTPFPRQDFSNKLEITLEEAGKWKWKKKKNTQNKTNTKQNKHKTKQTQQLFRSGSKSCVDHRNLYVKHIKN